MNHGIPPVDHHIHSVFSDGTGTPEEYVDSALRKRLDEIALTEHVWETSKWVAQFVQAIKDLSKLRGFRVFAGVEAKAITLQGDVDLDDRYRADLDLVMGVVHRYPTEVSHEFADHSKMTAEEAALRETEAIIGMIRRGSVHVIGHPTRTYYRYYENAAPFPREYLEEIVSAARKYQVPLELTGAWCPDDTLIHLGLKENVLISLGSDSHSPEGVGRTFSERFLAALEKL